jgi:hypothetical protein
MPDDEDLFGLAVAAVGHVASSSGVRILLVGAYARDLLLGRLDSVLDQAYAMDDDGWDDIDRRCRRWLGGELAALSSARMLGALEAILRRETDPKGDGLLVRRMSGRGNDAEDARLALLDLREGLVALPGSGG